MVARPRRPWSTTVEAGGVSVRLFERGSAIYRDVSIGGKRDRASMKHNDRTLAVSQARALAERLGELRYAGTTGAALTLGALLALFRQYRIPHLSKARGIAVRTVLDLVERGIGRAVPVQDIAQHHVDGYIAARRDGTLRTAKHRGEGGVAVASCLNELAILRSVLRWARTYRQGGRPLLTSNPLEGLTLPQVKNTRRPVATEARFRALLAVADRADPGGRFACLLSLARFTGRRITALCQLRASDILLTREAVEAALDAVGQPTEHAVHWPYGAIHFRSASDKSRVDRIAPLGREAREALDVYLRARPIVGDAPLFPGAQNGLPVRRHVAAWWLHRAEKLAKLPQLEGGAYHPYRRAWAGERRHLPATDVAAAGGWQSLAVMQRSYQTADAATMFSVTDSPTVRPISGTRRRKSK